MKKRFIKVFFIILSIFFIIFISFIVYMFHGQKEVLNTKIGEINLANKADGNYEGTFNGYRWTNTVKVSIKNHKITDIIFIKGQVFRVADVENKLISNVIAKQSTKVDTISGATVSSKAILKAIENAIK